MQEPRCDAFRAAVAAIHAGDVVELARLLDAEPRLLHERAVRPESYGASEAWEYFRDPKLVWFVANNPMLVAALPANIVDVARVMLERGVESADLAYALELTMTGGTAREQGLQIPLMRLFHAAGAVATHHAIVSAAAHREHAALRELLDLGYPRSVPIVAALGVGAELRGLLEGADRDTIQTAFVLAVVNGTLDTARIALDAGADPAAPLPVHAHSTALHQAALNGDVPMIELLLARGARTDVRDALWNGTPLDWARHEHRAEAVALLAARG
jgi:hypothetical protein